MCTANFDKEALNVTIYSQYLGLELTSPVYFSNDTPCHVFSGQQMDISTISNAGFGIYSKQHYFKGGLSYKVKRKYASITDNQPNNSTDLSRTLQQTYIFWWFGMLKVTIIDFMYV
jgi:hypothetical protein